jgi:2-hydroxychromene-2-carboxylate isomerase
VSQRPVFHYDFSSPYSYLAAERVNAAFAEAGSEPPRWQPISFGHVIQAIDKTPWSMGAEKRSGMAEVERRAAERDLPPLRWPEGWPVETYSLAPLRAAIYAEQTGRLIAFSLAAFRQAFAAGRDLSEPDNIVLAAAACELHPKAVLKGIETESVKKRLREATEAAIELGITGVPTIVVDGELFWGDDRLEEAAAAAAA